MNSNFPTERDILTALLDAVIALSKRIFPEEDMVIQIRSLADGGHTFVNVGQGSQTTWIKPIITQLGQL